MLNQEIQEIPKTTEKFNRLLESLEITPDDLTAHGIDYRELAHILELPWYARAQRWLVYDETIRKFLLLLLSRDKNIVEADTALLDVASERPRTQVESISIPLLSHQAKAKSRCCSLSAFAHWCGSHFYPQSNSFLLIRARALKKAFFIHGLVNGIETITMRVWSLILFSFMAIDLYYYYAYPDQRYGNTLAKIFFASSDNDVGFSSALLLPTVWPKLLALPTVWGLVSGLRKLTLVKETTETGILANYRSRGPRDFCIWLLPCHLLQSALEKIELLLLWDGRLSFEKRKELFLTLAEVARNSTKLTQLHALAILAELADYPGPKDLRRLHRLGISEESLVQQLELKFLAYEELKGHSHYQPEEGAQRGRNTLTRIFAPLPRYLYVNYLLWCLGAPGIILSLQPLFWSYKTFIFYLKGRLLWTVSKGILKIIQRYIDKRACEKRGTLWIRMEQVGDYKCTVCGDLPIPYPDVFTLEDCLEAYLLAQRIEEEIIAILKRFDLSSFKSFDFLPHQLLNSTSFGNILDELCPRIPNAEILYLDFITEVSAPIDHPYKPISQPIIGISHGLRAVLNLTSLNYLDLTNRNIDLEALTVVEQLLSQSRISYLDLSFNYIGAEGIKNFTIALQTQSAFKYLYLGGTNIGDKELEILATALPNPLLELSWSSIDIGDEGVKVFATKLPKQLQALYLSENKWNLAEQQALTRAKPNTLLEELLLNGNKITDSGAKKLCEVLPYTSMELLSLAGNPIQDPNLVHCAFSSASASEWPLPIRLLQSGYHALFGPNSFFTFFSRKETFDALPFSQAQDAEFQAICLSKNRYSLFAASTAENSVLSNPALIMMLLTMCTLLMSIFPYRKATAMIERMLHAFEDMFIPQEISLCF